MNSDLDGKGEILIGDGSGDPTALAVGTNDYVLTADSSEATGVKWAEASGGGGVTSDNQYNTVAGTNAGDSFTGTDAEENTLFGYDAGTAITEGDNNTFIGSNSGESLTTGNYNTFVGRSAGKLATTGSSNTLIGHSAGGSAIYGKSNNVVIGLSLIHI